MPTVFRISQDTVSMTKNILTQIEAWDEATEILDTYEIDELMEFDESADARDLIKVLFGNTIWGMEPINQLSFADNGYLLCNGYFTEWEGFNENQVLNENYITNENIVFNESNPISGLFNAMIGLTIIDIPLDKIVLGNNKIGAKAFLENQTL